MKILLIGFMGSGKSTVAALLAERMGVPLLEMDAEIVRRSGGMSIPQIFETFGERHFRDIESQVAASYAGEHSLVISAGGGTPERKENMTALKSGKSFTVFLEVPFTTVLSRLEKQRDRPLLQDLNQAELLFDKRQGIYRSYADLVLSGEHAPEMICETIEKHPGVVDR